MSKAAPKRFAVCLAAYNGMAFISEQIASILSQKHVDLQIFISIDQSSDGTETFLAEWSLREPRLRILDYGNRFGGAGPNFYRILREVDLHDFDYLSFADQDDVWHPDKLFRAHCAMAKENALGYSSNFSAVWPNGQVRKIYKNSRQRNWDYLFESAGPGCTYVLRRDLAVAVQKFVWSSGDRLLMVDYHDWLIYAFARTHKRLWFIDDWSSMQYRQHGSNQLGVNSGWIPFVNRVKKVMNGYGIQQTLLIADMLKLTSLPIVQRGLLGGRVGYLWLALRAKHCRRKPLHQLLFLLACMYFAVFKPYPYAIRRT
jgi:rhamnosyltransferase